MKQIYLDQDNIWAISETTVSNVIVTKVLYFESNVINICPSGQVNNVPALVEIMVRR